MTVENNMSGDVWRAQVCVISVVMQIMWPELALQGARKIQGNPLEDQSFESLPYKPAHRPGHMQRPVKRRERLAPW